VVQDHEGKQVAGQETVSVIRNFRNNVTNVLGSDNEEAIIRREMNQSAVIKILRRMKAIAEYQ
jgi:outer membrane lipopolysaccharide assembly protein LptE/RlpB